jgi:galactarate dehydratase
MESSMSHEFFSPVFSRDIPSTVAGEGATEQDMARVTEADWTALAKQARRYCRKVDAARSRKRADGSATIARDGRGSYGTDDVADDMTQDAVLIFARRLGVIIGSCPVVSCDVATREPDGWQYTTKDGEILRADRALLRRWAIGYAAQRNGYRFRRPGSEATTPEAAEVRARYLSAVTHFAGMSDVIFASAWGDGRDFPTLKRIMDVANRADDLGRAGVFSTVAQQMYGGKYGSPRPMRRVRDAARAEARELSARCDAVRDDLAHRDTPVKRPQDD